MEGSPALSAAHPMGGRYRWRREATGVLGAVGLAVASAPGTAGAEEPLRGARLHLQLADGIAGCPTEAELAARVRAATPPQVGAATPPQVGAAAPNASAAATPGASAPGNGAAQGLEDVTLAVSIFRDEAGLVGRVVVTGGRVGQRELRAASCAGLGDALVVLIGMVLDEEVRAAQAELALTTEDEGAGVSATTPAEDAVDATPPASIIAVPKEPGPPPGPSPTIPPPPARRAPSEHGVARTMTARAVAAAGVSTELTEALFGGLELGWAPFSLRALVAWRLPSEVDLDPGRITSRWVGGVLAGCGGLGQRWRATGCVQGWGGSLHAAAGGFTSSTEYDRLWTALGASAGLETGRRVTLGAEATGLVPLNRDRFHVVNVGSWDAGRPSAWLVARAGVAFR